MRLWPIQQGLSPDKDELEASLLHVALSFSSMHSCHTGSATSTFPRLDLLPWQTSGKGAMRLHLPITTACLMKVG